MFKTLQILDKLRPDFDIVVDLVGHGSSVLDLGCGGGILLERLIKEKSVRGFGVEIDENNVIECIGRGLPVYQGNIDEGLNSFHDNSYDFVILNQTLQVAHKPDYVLREMLRVGKQAIVSFPNFAYWKVRLNFVFTGRMPKSDLLPFEWYNTPNIHLLSVSDFRNLCREKQWVVIKEVFVGGKRDVFSGLANVMPNLAAEEAIFLVARKD